MAVLTVPFLALVASHCLFRYGYYGEWLPNMYYAKHVRPWCAMGIHYLGAAAAETGLYLLVLLGGAGARQGMVGATGPDVCLAGAVYRSPHG